MILAYSTALFSETIAVLWAFLVRTRQRKATTSANRAVKSQNRDPRVPVATTTGTINGAASGETAGVLEESRDNKNGRPEPSCLTESACIPSTTDRTRFASAQLITTEQAKSTIKSSGLDGPEEN